MALYRKKPVVIQAYQWDGQPDSGLERWMGDAFESWIPSKRQLAIRTLEGEHIISAGDWIIRGVEGEIYGCKASVFEKTYELAE
jgi:hypothetical protein